MTITPVSFSVGFIFVGVLLICILGIITYPKETFSYLIGGAFSVGVLFLVFKASKIWKADNNIDQTKRHLELELKKIKPIDNKQKKLET